MLKKLRKSSGRVTLVLIGAAALAGCSTDRREVYATQADCLADWGNTPQDCTPATESRHASRGFWYGPSGSYRGSSGTTWTRSSGTFSSSRSSSRSSSSSSSSSSRGGFGSSGRSSSSS
jgi:hypothetical protein